MLCISSSIHRPKCVRRRQLPAKSTLAITYTNALGVHEFRSESLNAPANPLFLMTSSGVYRQNQVIFKVVTKFSPAVSLNSYYALNRAMSNTDGLGTFPAIAPTISGHCKSCLFRLTT